MNTYLSYYSRVSLRTRSLFGRLARRPRRRPARVAGRGAVALAELHGIAAGLREHRAALASGATRRVDASTRRLGVGVAGRWVEIRNRTAPKRVAGDGGFLWTGGWFCWGRWAVL